MDNAERRRLFLAERKRVLGEMANVSTQTLNRVMTILGQAQTQIRQTLTGNATDYQRWQGGNAIKQIDEALNRFAKGGAEAWTTGVNDAWQKGVDLVDRPLFASGVKATASLHRISDRQLVAMRAFLTDRIGDISSEAKEAINLQLGLAISGAQTVGDTITNVDQILGGNARRRAATITNTELNRAFALATYERLLESAQRVPGLRKQWRRSGKIHSRIEHDLIDGQVQDVAVPFQVGAEQLRFPRDPQGSAKNTINCGCKLLPAMKHWQVAEPGPRPFTPEEIARNPIRAELNDLIAKTRGTPIKQVPNINGPLGIPISQSMSALRDAQAAVLMAEETLLVRKKREHAVVVATDGTIIAKRAGDMRSVSFTEAETNRMVGAVLSHNHPSGFTFSVADIQFAAVHGLAEMRVYAGRNLYRLRPPDGGWSAHWVQVTLMPAMKRLQIEVQLIAVAQARKQRLKRHERDQIAQDLLVRYLARELGMRLQVITP